MSNRKVWTYTYKVVLDEMVRVRALIAKAERARLKTIEAHYIVEWKKLRDYRDRLLSIKRKIF